MQMKIIVTGCAGYIGGTFCYEALKKGLEVIGIDNFSNSNGKLINYFLENYPNNFNFIESDIRDRLQMNEIFNSYKDVECIIHFAALKSVPESEEFYDLYWQNNVEGTENILELMKITGIQNIIFSSSAAIYGEQKNQPINEKAKPNPISNYALTKFESEKRIKRFVSNGLINAVSLRYFNPVAAHSDYLVYEDYRNSNNLMSMILKAATKEIESLKIYGNDYLTYDGTAERDFIHIQDLINGHFFALDKIGTYNNYHEINLGTGSSVSVLEMVETFKRVNKVKFKIDFANRRKGDVSINYAQVDKAKEFLGWQSSYNLEKMCKDAWEVIQNELK